MKRILIVEDEQILALMLEDILMDEEYDVIHAFDLASAEALLATEKVDAAILDINIRGASIFPLAEKLRRANVPLLFASSANRREIPSVLRGAPLISKPYMATQILTGLTALLGTQAIAIPPRVDAARTGRTTGEHPVL